MTQVLKTQGYDINRKRVRRLMQEMGLEAIYPKKNLSQPGDSEMKFPYLMSSLKIDRPNKAWCADITYIPLRDGFGYCVAVMDWWSRCVLAWRVSNTMDVGFCLEALEEAFSKGKPEVFNTDQGSQFTSTLFVETLLREQIRVSWDGRGRALDNVFIERLWRSLKYEDVYLRDYKILGEAREGIAKYFNFYNQHRPHQALKNQTPMVMHFAKVG
jgi:putative transposase